ncbi:uncharacterized protein TRUGW13939_06981 [Talaromyces rugulosus]|uniref:Uncharacterized protein n=1 Tax=Talaromyces rugulosus TaxID=121627 RepID=A0A7H8R0C9_TALRU|nr:uncharacterized protein TRUGW13939_06981 [Talaromyces rugulosus]QKX59839.1 hypothetical protein TRUGW13939_06981 [Talaromyces rugulosus]
MSTVAVVAGFSQTNRWLMYASFMLAPAQFVGGLGSNCPSNIGFLAYNWYTQIQWYQAVKAKQLHALSLLPVHFNFLYVLTYLGGITSGNIFMGLILGLGTAGVMILNTISAWTSWATNQQDGFGVYQFFFFGWRTLSPGWHTFILLWQIADSILAFGCVLTALTISVMVTRKDFDEDKLPWYLHTYPMILLGSVAMLLAGWELILWAELIVSRNHIESETDMVAVWLFVAQVGAMLIPSCGSVLGCFRSGFRGPRSSPEEHGLV